MAAKQEKIETLSVDKIRDKPGEGLKGRIAGKLIEITGRKKVTDRTLPLPELVSGLECLMFVEGRYTAAFRFHDAPRKDSASVIEHLKPKHGVRKVMLVSGDRESEVRYLAESVGITEVHAGKSPEEKVAIVKEETAKAETLFCGRRDQRCSRAAGSDCWRGLRFAERHHHGSGGRRGAGNSAGENR
jgi:cation transport ATPase